MGYRIFQQQYQWSKETDQNKLVVLNPFGNSYRTVMDIYFKALQLGDASKVAPIDKLSVIFTIFLSFIILKESVSWKILLGGLLITGSSLITLLDKQ